MAKFLWLKRGDQAPVCQQTDKLGRLHIPSVAVTFSSDPQSIRLDGIGFNWDRDAQSPAYGYTDNSILKQIPDKGRSKAQPIVVDATSVAGDARLVHTLTFCSSFGMAHLMLQHWLQRHDALLFCCTLGSSGFVALAASST